MLAGILRVADGLDYTHRGAITDLACRITPRQAILRCKVAGDAQTEFDRALSKGGELLGETLNRKLKIVAENP